MENHSATMNRLHSMRLHGMAEAVRNLIETGSAPGLSGLEVLSYAVDAEWDYKHNRKFQRLSRDARFRYQASLEEIDYSLERNLERMQVLALADCSWIDRGKDLLITGSTGCGKSYLASALGYHACAREYSVGYYNCSRFFSECSEAKADGSFRKIFRRLSRFALLILDDFGLEMLDHEKRMLLLEILEDRHRRKSTVLVSQVPVSGWHQLIGEPTIADAIMDRLVYNSIRIELKGESVRKKIYGVD